MRRWTALLGMLLANVGTAAMAAAPDAFELAVSHRTRYEAIGGQARAGFGSSDDLLNFRTILSAKYYAGALTFGGELWDSRVYLADRRTPVTTGEVNSFEPVQAYVIGDLGPVLGSGSKVSLQGGRFLLNLGSRRLIAADDYRNTTNGYTGARIDFEDTKKRHATLIYTLPQIRRPDTLDALLDNRPKFDHEGFDAVLWGGIVANPRAIGAATAEISFFHFGERDARDRPTRDRSLDTVSLRLARTAQAGRADFDLEGIGQSGHAAASLTAGAPIRPVRAWFVHAALGYTIPITWKPRFALEFDQASGDRGGRHYARFDTLFGMRRADFAPAGLYNAVTRANILTPGARIEAVPGPRTDLFVSYRAMWLSSRTDSFATTGVRDLSGRSGRFAGHQIDARVRQRVTRNLLLEADGTLLRKGRALIDAPNGTAGSWTRYLSLNALVTFASGSAK